MHRSIDRIAARASSIDRILRGASGEKAFALLRSGGGAPWQREGKIRRAFSRQARHFSFHLPSPASSGAPLRPAGIPGWRPSPRPPPVRASSGARAPGWSGAREADRARPIPTPRPPYILSACCPASSPRPSPFPQTRPSLRLRAAGDAEAPSSSERGDASPAARRLDRRRAARSRFRPRGQGAALLLLGGRPGCYRCCCRIRHDRKGSRL